jgi:hypothetical protein
MWRLASVVLVVTGCNRDVEHDAFAATPPPVAEAHVVGRSHRANIREVSVSGRGDVALARSVPVPTQIAIAGTPNEVTVGLVDQAGSAHVLRIGRVCEDNER